MSAPSTLRLWFRPGLLALHLLAVVALAACVVGGQWQLGAYQSEQNAEAASQDAAQPLTDVWAPGEPFTSTLKARAVTAVGEFAPMSQQLWVVGPSTGGSAWLVSPFFVEDSPAALLVVRGEAAEPGSLPPVPEGRQELELFLQPNQGGGGALDDERVTSGVNVPVLLNELPYRLYSGYGAAATDTGSGLALLPEPDPDVRWTVGLNNLAYTIQWWVFGAFALFMWWRMCTDQVARARALRPDEDDPEPDHPGTDRAEEQHA